MNRNLIFKFALSILLVNFVNSSDDVKPADTAKERKDEAESTSNESRTILILLTVIVSNFFIGHMIKILKTKFVRAGRFIQVAPMSF